MFVVPRGLKILVIDHPYRALGHPETQHLFGRLMGMKIAGYRAAYPFGVLPVDTYDFVASHILVCVPEGSDGWKPLGAGRVISEERCEAHRLPFPAQALLRDAQSDTSRHLQAVEEIVAAARSRMKRLDYHSSWTLSPALRDQPELRRFVRDVMVSTLITRMVEDVEREHLLCGVLRMKTDELFKWVGYEPLKAGTEVLPEILQRSLFGEPVLMFHSTGVTAEAREMTQRFRALWEERQILAGDVVVSSDQRAA